MAARAGMPVPLTCAIYIRRVNDESHIPPLPTAAGSWREFGRFPPAPLHQTSEIRGGKRPTRPLSALAVFLTQMEEPAPAGDVSYRARLRQRRRRATLSSRRASFAAAAAAAAADPDGTFVTVSSLGCQRTLIGRRHSSGNRWAIPE